jgi:hypothetical protein
MFSSSSLSSSESPSSCASSLAVVLFLISRLFRSTICKYVSFKRGMKHSEHTRGRGGGGEEGIKKWFLNGLKPKNVDIRQKYQERVN